MHLYTYTANDHSSEEETLENIRKDCETLNDSLISGNKNDLAAYL